MQFLYFEIAIKLSLVASLHSPVFYRSANEKIISKSEFENRNKIVLAYDSQDCQKACLGVGTCQFEDYRYLSDGDREYLLNAAVSPYCSQHHRPRCDEDLLANKSGFYLTPVDEYRKQTQYSHPSLNTENCCVSGHSRLRGDPLPDCGASEPDTRRLCTCRKGSPSPTKHVEDLYVSAASVEIHLTSDTTTDSGTETSPKASEKLSSTSTVTPEIHSASTTISGLHYNSSATSEVSSASAFTTIISTITSTTSATENNRNLIIILAASLSFIAFILFLICVICLVRKHRVKNRKVKNASIPYLDVHPRSKFGTESSCTVPRKHWKSDSRSVKVKTTKIKSQKQSFPKSFAKSKSSRVIYSGKNMSISDTAYEAVN